MSYLQPFSMSLNVLSSNVMSCYCYSIEIVRSRACHHEQVHHHGFRALSQEQGYHNMHEVMAFLWLVQGHLGHYDLRESR